MRIPLLTLFLATLLSAHASDITSKHTGNWLMVNGILILQVSAKGDMTLRNTGASGKIEIAADGSFHWKIPDQPVTTGRFDGDRLFLKSDQPNTPKWLDFLEFRRADDKIANEVIELALRQQSAALASMAKVRQSSIKMAVLNNLRQLSAAADQYYLENGVTETSLDKLVGPEKYISKLEAVDGETYKDLDFKQDAHEWKIVTASGQIVTYSR